MTKRTYYEWCIATFETNRDEADIDHSDVFPSYHLVQAKLGNYQVEIELKKDVCYWDLDVTKQEVDSGLVEPDIQHECFAQFENGKLEEFFDDGKPVPKRFHNEIEKEQG